MKVTIVSKKDLNTVLDEITLDKKNPTLEDLKKEFFKVCKVDVNRQYFNIVENGVVGGGLRPGNLPEAKHLVLAFKKLGLQVGYRTVFFVEYFVPMISFPLIYLLRPLLYGADAVAANPLTGYQQLAFWLHTIHFLKRELETLFVHKFSNATMPVFNIFKNSSYYWAYAFLCGYFILHPFYTAPSSHLLIMVCTALFVLCMISNGICHIMLANLRKPGDRNKYIPKGFLFDFVTCPNYFFEISQWLIFAVQTQCLAVLLFALTGAGQMYIWALGKHKLMKKTFDGKDGREAYPRNRKVLVPFLL